MGIPNPLKVRDEGAIGPADKTADTSTGSDCIGAALTSTLVAVGTDVAGGVAVGKGVAVGVGVSVGSGAGVSVDTGVGFRGVAVDSGVVVAVGTGLGVDVAVGATVNTAFTCASTVASISTSGSAIPRQAVSKRSATIRKNRLLRCMRMG